MKTLGFPQEVSDAALIACGRRCCICHIFCGTKMELHHIKQAADGGEDTFENCIPLCFNCHSEMGKADPKHPKGKRYTEDELRGHRDNWYEKVKNGSFLRPADVCDSDRRLFSEICATFDKNISYLLSSSNVSGRHLSHQFDALAFLFEKAKDPFFEFLDLSLEELKGTLFHAIDVFLDYYNYNVFSTGSDDIGYCASHLWLFDHDYIPRSNVNYEEYRATFYKQFEDEATELNNLARNVWSCYCDFVRQGRLILNE